MAIHNALGKAGEDAVAAYLEHNGYVIRDRNWRKNRLELDIVATKDNGLIIVEVKTRSNTEYIKPLSLVATMSSSKRFFRQFRSRITYPLCSR